MREVARVVTVALLVTALWAHRDAYLGWLDNPRRADGQD